MEVDFKKTHEESMLSMYAADILMWYISDDNFRRQVNAILGDESVKASLRGEPVDLHDMMLTISLREVTKQWRDQYYNNE